MWSLADVPFFFPLWWFSWIGANILSRFDGSESTNPSTVSAMAWTWPAMSGLAALAAIMLVVIARSTYRLQERKSRAPVRSETAPTRVSNLLLR